MGGKPEHDLAYTKISNKAYKSVSSMFEDEKLGQRRDYEDDTQTVVRWLEGSYPDFFYVVELDDIERFVEEYNAIENRQHYEVLVACSTVDKQHRTVYSNNIEPDDAINNQQAYPDSVLRVQHSILLMAEKTTSTSYSSVKKAINNT